MATKSSKSPSCVNSGITFGPSAIVLPIHSSFMGTAQSNCKMRLTNERPRKNINLPSDLTVTETRNNGQGGRNNTKGLDLGSLFKDEVLDFGFFEEDGEC